MALALFLAAAIFLSVGTYIIKNQEKEIKEARQTRFMMGTMAEIKIVASKKQLKESQEIFNQAFDLLAQIEETFTYNHADSQDTQPQKTNQDLIYVSQRSQEFSHLTGGVWDITVGPLVKLWNIRPGQKNRLPSQEEIDQALTLISYEDMKISDHGIEFAKSGMFADYGGIAKGYAADRLADLLREKGIKSASINLGGDIYVLGNNLQKDAPWKFGIQDPFLPMGHYLASINLENKSLVTSGSYERFFEEDGKIYHHLFDPRTGWPADNELVSVSVLSESSLEGDALSTAAFILGLEEGLELIENDPGVQALFISKDKEIYLTSGFDEETFNLVNNEYRIVKNVKKKS